MGLSRHIDVGAYAALAERCWQLRPNLTIHDATYVALVESLDARLATFDQRARQRTRSVSPLHDAELTRMHLGSWPVAQRLRDQATPSCV